MDQCYLHLETVAGSRSVSMRMLSGRMLVGAGVPGLHVRMETKQHKAGMSCHRVPLTPLGPLSEASQAPKHLRRSSASHPALSAPISFPAKCGWASGEERFIWDIRASHQDTRSFPGVPYLCQPGKTRPRCPLLEGFRFMERNLILSSEEFDRCDVFRLQDSRTLLTGYDV